MSINTKMGRVWADLRPNADWVDRNHFIAVAAEMMRRVLVDHAHCEMKAATFASASISAFGLKTIRSAIRRAPFRLAFRAEPDDLCDGQDRSVVHRGDSNIALPNEALALVQEVLKDGFMRAVSPRLEATTRVAGNRRHETAETMLATASHWFHCRIDMGSTDATGRIVFAA